MHVDFKAVERVPPRSQPGRLRLFGTGFINTFGTMSQRAGTSPANATDFEVARLIDTFPMRPTRTVRSGLHA